MSIKVQGTTVISDGSVFYPLNTVDRASTVSISSGTLTLDLQSSSMFELNLTSSVTTLTLNNVASSSGTNVTSFTLITIGDGTARTVAWPGTFVWPGGTAPTITSTYAKRDVFVFFYENTVWHAFIAGQNL